MRERIVGDNVVDVDDISHIEWNGVGGVNWLDFKSRPRLLMDRDVNRAYRSLKKIIADENPPNLNPPPKSDKTPATID